MLTLFAETMPVLESRVPGQQAWVTPAALWLVGPASILSSLPFRCARGNPRIVRGIDGE